VQYSILKLAIFTSLLLLNLFVSISFAHLYIDDPQNHYYLKYIWMIPIYALFYAYYRLLSKRMVMSMEFMYMEKANVLALIIITLIVFASKTSIHYSRSIVLLFFILNFLMPIWVYFLKRYFMMFARFREDILVICDKAGEEDVNNWFVKDNSFGFNVANKIIVDEISDEDLQARIQELVDQHKHYAVVVSLADKETDNAFQTVNYVLHHVSRVYVLPNISKLPLINSEFFNSINHKGMALYVKNKLLHDGERNIKAIFDRVLSVTLFFLFLPILLILYAVVYISTNGHPIYKQRRIGKDGKDFNIYKFRTMKIDADQILEEILENDPILKAEWEREFKLKDDPRITKIGKFLRRTSLDELPQIYNVFQGKMSLVGPRPIIKDEIVKYDEFFDYFKWSMELDIMILVKTAAMVLMRKGSY